MNSFQQREDDEEKKVKATVNENIRAHCAFKINDALFFRHSRFLFSLLEAEEQQEHHNRHHASL